MMIAMFWGAVALGAVGMICFTALSGWKGWLDLKRFELARSEAGSEPMPLHPAARIEVADLRERVRSLEALAKGVDL